MEKNYIEFTYFQKDWDAIKTTVVEVETEVGLLISECAEIARKKLEDNIGKIIMVKYRYLGHNVAAIN